MVAKKRETRHPDVVCYEKVHHALSIRANQYEMKQAAGAFRSSREGTKDILKQFCVLYGLVAIEQSNVQLAPRQP